MSPSKFRTWKDIHTARLYHYEKFCPAWLTTTLKDKKIHCSDPTKLNDPWDFKPWFHRKADASGPAMDWEAMSVGVQKEIAKRRIYCLTPDSLSTLMWSHYGGDHRGICLEFHLSNLLFNKVMGVRYEEEYPSILPEEMFARVREAILTKADCWKYEEEFRLIGSPDLPEDDPQRLHGDFLKLPDLALMSIIVGCNGDYDAVKKIVDQHAPGLRVSQIVRLPSEYKLTVALAPEEYRKQRMLSWPRRPDLISQLDRVDAASS